MRILTGVMLSVASTLKTGELISFPMSFPKPFVVTGGSGGTVVREGVIGVRSAFSLFFVGEFGMVIAPPGCLFWETTGSVLTRGRA